MDVREFDLNIEKILENWEIYHAIREIISNALDEKTLTNTEEIKIYEDLDGWHIRDFGRGLSYHHLTQNENVEKLNHSKLIGKFGVGLKDALATLYRNKISVKIVSRYGMITLKELAKAGFNDIITLHARIAESTDKDFIGTDFAVYGCKIEDIQSAKDLFLCYAEHSVIESTQFGDVIKKEGTPKIYINGVMVAEEENFLFSYNITSLSKQLKKHLNRERTNVGRTAYTERIKSILLNCKSLLVVKEIVEDLQQYTSGLRHDEISWTEVSIHASKMLAEQNKNIVFISPATAMQSPNLVDEMKLRGFTPIAISESLINKIEEKTDLTTISRFVEKMENQYVFDFVSFEMLNIEEQIVFKQTNNILFLIGGKPSNVREIKISNTIIASEIFCETTGVWNVKENIIVIKRSELKNIRSYAAVLIHESIHARSGYGDVSRRFEAALTAVIGEIVEKLKFNTEI